MHNVVTSSPQAESISEFLKRAKPAPARAVAELVWGYSRLFFFLWLFGHFSNPKTFIFAFCMSAATLGYLLALAHDAHHAALFRNRRVNEFVGAWLCAYPTGSIYGAARAVHLAHHKYLNTTADPDLHFHSEGDKSTPQSFVRFFLSLVLGRVWWNSIVINGILRLTKGHPGAPASSVVVLPERKYPEILNLIPVQAVVFAVFWLITGYWWAYFAIWLGSIFTIGTAFGFLRAFMDHARLADDDPRLSAQRLITISNPSLLEQAIFAGLDFYYHAEHHLFPSVPHYYLPKLHNLLQNQSQYRERYLTRPSYIGFLCDYWKQICSGRKSLDSTRSEGPVLPGQGRKPKVLFIEPKLPRSFWGLEYATAYSGWRFPGPPLGLLTLAGAISPEYEVEVRDENARPVDYPTDADIVGLSGVLLHDNHVERLLALARYFKGQGKMVCIGGPVANLSPEVVRPYCDVLFEGEGELTWPQFLKDYEAGCHKDSYVQVEKYDLSQSPMPRIDLVNAMDYAYGQVQTTRGCPFTCEFCDIIVVFGRKVRAKPVERVMQEVRAWSEQGQSVVLFSDDNFIGNRVYAKELLKAIIEFNSGRKHPMHFWTQASIDMAKDPELLALMRKANFAGMFIGVESPRKDSLTETHKVQNVHTADLLEAIHTIQSYGLWISAGMIIGFDHDDAAIFDEQFEFLQKAGVPFAQLSLLQAIPKTPLYERMKEAGRLIEYRSNLATNIVPKNMSYLQILEGYCKLVQRLYTYDAYLERFLMSLKQMRHQTFEQDIPRQTWANRLRSLRVCSYYLFTTDWQRIRFFWRMVIGTAAIQPRAMVWTLRYLCNFIHFYRYANEDILITAAPVDKGTGETVPVAQPAGAS